ncbi:hypothetical protein EGP98_00800 [bacterium]|nr:hypothetical protein [bacterium]
MKKKENKKVINNLFKTERGRAILFFLFYFIFFLVLILMIRTNVSNTKKGNIKENTTTIKANYDLTKISNGNYRFTREEDRGNVKTTFTGETNGGRSYFLMTSDKGINSYFSYNGIYLLKENNTYKVAANPYLYARLNEYSVIKAILDNAHLKAKTTYENGNTVYQYEISSTSLLSIIDEKETDLDDQVNLVNLVINEDKDVIGISYQLDSYHTYIRNIPETLTIKIDYSDYGKVKELEIPS